MDILKLEPPYDEILRIVLNYAHSNAYDIADTIDIPFSEWDVEYLAKILGIEL